MKEDEPVQWWAQKIGSYGCYLLCILKHFGAEMDVIKWYKRFLDEGFVRTDCFIKEPGRIAQELSGKKYEVRFEGPGYKVKDGEFAVLHWKSGSMEHFTLEAWDPMGHSLTRASGRVDSMRVFREVKP